MTVENVLKFQEVVNEKQRRAKEEKKEDVFIKEAERHIEQLSIERSHVGEFTPPLDETEIENAAQEYPKKPKEEIKAVVVKVHQDHAESIFNNLYKNLNNAVESAKKFLGLLQKRIQKLSSSLLLIPPTIDEIEHRDGKRWRKGTIIFCSIVGIIAASCALVGVNNLAWLLHSSVYPFIDSLLLSYLFSTVFLAPACLLHVYDENLKTQAKKDLLLKVIFICACVSFLIFITCFAMLNSYEFGNDDGNLFQTGTRSTTDQILSKIYMLSQLLMEMFVSSGCFIGLNRIIESHGKDIPYTVRKDNPQHTALSQTIEVYNIGHEHISALVNQVGEDKRKCQVSIKSLENSVSHCLDTIIAKSTTYETKEG